MTKFGDDVEIYVSYQNKPLWSVLDPSSNVLALTAAAAEESAAGAAAGAAAVEAEAEGAAADPITTPTPAPGKLPTNASEDDVIGRINDKK